MRIAKPLLFVSTAIGVVSGLREAWRFHWWLALLMFLLMAVIAAFIVLTVIVFRREQRQPRR